jgi:hypothetical protein
LSWSSTCISKSLVLHIWFTSLTWVAEAMASKRGTSSVVLSGSYATCRVQKSCTVTSSHRGNKGSLWETGQRVCQCHLFGEIFRGIHQRPTSPSQTLEAMEGTSNVGTEQRTVTIPFTLTGCSSSKPILSRCDKLLSKLMATESVPIHDIIIVAIITHRPRGLPKPRIA